MPPICLSNPQRIPIRKQGNGLTLVEGEPVSEFVNGRKFQRLNIEHTELILEFILIAKSL